MKKQGNDGVGSFAFAKGLEGKAEGEQIENKGNEFLVDVCERDPMLTVAGEDQY